MDAAFPKEEEDKGLDQELPVQINEENTTLTVGNQQELLVPVGESDQVLPGQMKEAGEPRLVENNEHNFLVLQEKEKDGTVMKEIQQELSVVEKVEKEVEEMEVSMATPEENPIMTLNNATPPHSESRPAKTRDEQTHLPASLVAETVCMVEDSDNEDTEDSDRCSPHTHHKIFGFPVIKYEMRLLGVFRN